MPSRARSGGRSATASFFQAETAVHLPGVAAHADLAVVSHRRAVGDESGQLVAPGVGEPGDPEHLAAVQREGGVPQVDAGQAPHLEHWFGAGALRHGGAVVGFHLHTQHQVNQLGLGEPGHVAGGDLLAVAEHRHPVAQVEDLVEAMRDVDDPRTAIAQIADDSEQPMDLVRWENGSRFVEDQHASFAVPALEGGGDGDDRALDWRRLRERLVDVEVDGEGRHQPACGADLLTPSDPAHTATHVAAVHGEVLDGVHLEDEPEVLVHEAQAA